MNKIMNNEENLLNLPPIEATLKSGEEKGKLTE